MEELVFVEKDRTIISLRSKSRSLKTRMRAAANEAGIIIVGAARGNILPGGTPSATQPRNRTGNLQRAVGYEVSGRGSTGTVLRYTTRVTVGRTAPYGKYVEEGTGLYGPRHAPFLSRHGSGLYMHPGMRARPFLSPALDESAGAVRAAYRRAVRAAMR